MSRHDKEGYHPETSEPEKVCVAEIGWLSHGQEVTVDQDTKITERSGAVFVVQPPISSLPPAAISEDELNLHDSKPFQGPSKKPSADGTQ